MRFRLDYAINDLPDFDATPAEWTAFHRKHYNRDGLFGNDGFEGFVKEPRTRWIMFLYFRKAILDELSSISTRPTLPTTTLPGRPTRSHHIGRTVT